MTDTFDLKLSTSKMQHAVSDVVSRIGFEHVKEHVITMEDMAIIMGSTCDHNKARFYRLTLQMYLIRS